MLETISPASRRAVSLRAALARVIRASGALDPGRTACGIDLPPSHAHALMLLAREPVGTLSQRDVARALGLDKSSIARLCQRMVEAAHLEQARDRAGALGALSETLGTCTSCHATYRQELVDHARWSELTATSPPMHH